MDYKLSKKATSDNIIKTAIDSKNILKVLKNASDKVFGAGITLINNEIKDIIKVIKSLENRGILLNFIKPLKKLPVIKEDF